MKSESDFSLAIASQPFLEKVNLVGRNSFLILVLKIGRNIKKHPVSVTLFYLHTLKTLDQCRALAGRRQWPNEKSCT